MQGIKSGQIVSKGVPRSTSLEGSERLGGKTILLFKGLRKNSVKSIRYTSVYMLHTCDYVYVCIYVYKISTPPKAESNLFLTNQIGYNFALRKMPAYITIDV